MGKSLAHLKDNFSAQLNEAVNNINKLNKDLEALKIKQQQLIGAVYALELAITESTLPDEEPADTAGA